MKRTKAEEVSTHALSAASNFVAAPEDVEAAGSPGVSAARSGGPLRAADQRTVAQMTRTKVLRLLMDRTHFQLGGEMYAGATILSRTKKTLF